MPSGQALHDNAVERAERLAHGEWLNRRPACANGMPSGLRGLRRRQSWPDGPFVRLPWWPATPTAPIFGRRRSIWPSTQSFFPVVHEWNCCGLYGPLVKYFHLISSCSFGPIYSYIIFLPTGSYGISFTFTFLGVGGTGKGHERVAHVIFDGPSSWSASLVLGSGDFLFRLWKRYISFWLPAKLGRNY
jgi:hypothetical protein